MLWFVSHIDALLNGKNFKACFHFLCQHLFFWTSLPFISHLDCASLSRILYIWIVMLNVLWGLMPLSTISQLNRDRSVLLMQETGVPGENHRPVASHSQTLSHNVVHLALSGIRTNNIRGDGHQFHR